MSDDEKKPSDTKSKEYWYEYLEETVNDLQLTIQGNPFLSDVQKIIITKTGYIIQG